MERNYKDDIAFFVAFCIETYKNANHLTGGEASIIFNKHNIMGYLANNYEVLHTQSPRWILEEIENIVK